MGFQASLFSLLVVILAIATSPSWGSGISIVPSGDNVAGRNYSLECTVNVTAPNGQPVIMITWLNSTSGSEITSTADRMVSGIIIDPAGSHYSTLTFTPLRASDAGTFTCEAIILGNVIDEETVIQNIDITVHIPDPSVTVSSTPITAGSSVTVICTVELNQYVDVGLTVNIQWTGPDSVVISPTAPLMESISRYISTITFMSFGRVQSGVYACHANISSDTLMTSGTPIMGMERITVGIYLSLRGTVYANNSVIPITEIGQTDTDTMPPPPNSNNGLQCITDRIACCSTPPNRFGQWQFPNETNIGISGTTASFYRNRGDDGTVNLNRVSNDVMMPTGLFCCIVRDITEVDQTVCANIVRVSITSSSSPIVGENFILNCSVWIMIQKDTPHISFEWFHNSIPVENSLQLSDLSVSGVTNDSRNIYTSTLQFSPLSQSHAGNYTCQFGSNVRLRDVFPLLIIVTVSVSSITTSGTATAGESYSLECTVTVTGSTDQPTITWLMGPMNNVITSGVVMNGGMSTLTFNPLSASDAGTYTFRATLGSAMDSVSRTITVQNPTITVSVASSIGTPMVGSMYSLTCTVTGAGKLTDAGVMVTYQWLKNGAVVSNQTMATLSFSPLTFSDAGSYTCQATVTSSLLSDPIPTAPSSAMSVRLTLPMPAAIRILTNQTNPLMVRPIGSTVTLTCMADLDPAIDVPVTMNIQLSDPAGSPLTATTPSVLTGSTYSSMATISSFGRNDSGLYTCSATVSPSPSNSFLSNSTSLSGTLRVTTGVYLFLNQMVYANNSVIPITEIRTTSNTGLQCITDRMPCCASPIKQGDWFFPGGVTAVPGPLQRPKTFYRNRGDGTVNLNRISISTTSPVGKFCCVVSDDSNQTQSTCAIIVNTDIESSGSAVAGESYTLSCSIQGTNQATAFHWEGPDGNIISTTSMNPEVSSNGLVSVLIFSALLTSHGRNYTCEAYGRETTSLIINLPQISSVHITSTHTPVVLVGNSPTTNISLTCMVELPPSVDVELNVSTVWSGPGGTVFTPGSSVNATKFNFTMYTSTVMVDNINWGNYTCQAIVNSSLQFLTGEVNKTTETTIMAVPVNTTLSRHPSGHIRIGDDLAIFCNTSIDAVASSAISNSDINVTVSWGKANQLLITDQQQMTSNGHYDISEVIKSNSPGGYMYSSVLSISALSFADSQIYTCTATISSRMGSFNTTNQALTIDIQLIPTPPNVTLGEVTSTGVSISWVQDDRDTYSGFEITYIHHGPCFVNKTNVSRLLNTIFNHTIGDLEEFNNYTLVVYAVNTAGRSLRMASNTKNFKTHSGAPTGRPQSLHVESSRSNSTSIHFVWDRVNCTERNGEIIGYNISYYPEFNGHSSYKKSDNISGTSMMDRQYVATRLTPLTNYTFMVTAVSSYNGHSFSLSTSVMYQTNRTSEVIFFLKGMIHANNSIVDVNDIGSTTYEALLCLTNASNCCGGNHGNKGEWYLPNEVSVDDSDRMHFSKTRGPSVLYLTSRNDGLQSFPMGVHRCEIPDANGDNQSIYIGIYPSRSGVGEPMISNFPEYSSYNNSQIITCTSAGGPATTVEWWKDGNILRDEYEQLKRIINLTTAEYQSTLILGQSIPVEVIGNYTCRVSNARDEDTKTIRLHGIQITKIENGVPLGAPLSLNCTTDLASTNISWLDSNGKVLETTSSTQQLTWEISEITDAHHKSKYTCHVIGPFGDQNKSITLLVAQPSVADSSSTVGGVVAALLLLLLLMVGISVTIVIFIVRRSKNKTFRPFHKSVQYKPRKELGDDDYTPAPTTGTKGESIEMKQNEEEKEKDYYFMDTSLLAGEHVKPIPVSEFSSHVERLHADRDKLFEMEYESMSKHPQSSHAIADIPHNKCKNRFANIFPYDSSRVKLKEISGEDGSDYINASHLDGYNKPKAYIGAQGPMPNTVTDFWRMIWEKKLPTVVMLTRCFEGRKKCEEYWPLSVGEGVQPGHGLTITLNSTLPFAEYSLRKMTLTSSTAPGSAPLKVTQYHFTGWPDHGVPQNGVTLINFIRRVRTSHPYSDSRPLLVHCSAGVGRTGAFIVLDSMLQRMQGEQNLNIYEFLKQLRTQRVLMVQTQAQYNFIHDALNELILCGDTEITAPNLRIVISRLNKTTDGETGYNKQFNLIAQMSPGYSESDYTQANMECNLGKNRYPNILPNDHFRVMLRAATATGSDYINASFVDGYRQRGGYIATQAPMENTVSDFWRMVWDYQSRAIVMLCRMKEDGKEACCPYLPEHKGDSEVYGKIRVKLVSKETTTDYVIQQLEVSEDKPHPQGHASSETVVKVGVFHYIRWPKHGTPRGTAALLDLIQHINKTQMTSGNKPITVMCNDGVGRTGTFICIHAQLERLKTEGVVDFFQSIKSARIQRAGFVPDVHQYILCHNLVADYLDGFDTYANFKELV